MWHLNPKLHRVSKLPLNLDIEITNACNLKCTMCMRDFMKKGIGHMSFETFKKILDDCTPYAVKLNWRGEPLMNKEICKMIAYAKQKGVLEVLMNTNGLLLNEDLIHGLADAGLDWIIFSVDGATSETYEKIRIDGNFEKLVKNVMLTSLIYSRMDESPSIRIQICKQPANEHEIEQWKNFFEPYADQLRIGKLYDPQSLKGYKIDQPKGCTQFWQRLVIDWNGYIYPCCGDFLGKAILGNINDTTIYDAWHSKALNGLRYVLRTRGRSCLSICEKCTSYC